jgi:hypothetical protein
LTAVWIGTYDVFKNCESGWRAAREQCSIRKNLGEAHMHLKLIHLASAAALVGGGLNLAEAAWAQAPAAPATAPVSAPKMIEVFIPMRDGTKLAANVFLPEGRADV